MPMLMPKVGEIVKAKVTRVEISTAGKVFTNKAGQFTAKYSKESDKVFIIFGIVQGEREERKLGNVNAPKNVTGQLYGTANLYKILKSAGVEANERGEISDNLRELVGKTLPLVIDAKGFTRLA